MLQGWKVDPQAPNFIPTALIKYIEKQVANKELTEWVVAVEGLQKKDTQFGQINLGIHAPTVNLVSRTRKPKDTAIGAIVSPRHEAEGLTPEQMKQWEQRHPAGSKTRKGIWARQVRKPEEGLLLIYPISRYAGQGYHDRALYKNPLDPRANDVIALAISFPESLKAKPIRGEYIVGSVTWRPL